MASSRHAQREKRRILLQRLGGAGRDMSDAAVMFHTALAEKHGLSASEWKTLGLLERHGPTTMGGLSRLSGLSPPSITAIVKRLDAAGWIVRHRDAKDRRRAVVELNQSIVTKRMYALFEGLSRRLNALFERYDDRELELLADFLAELSRRQREATLEVTESGRTGTDKRRPK